MTPWQVVAWWERRRIPYNLIVGVTGILTCAVTFTMAFICERVVGVPIGFPDPPIVAVIGILVYGIMANVCFTGGWIVELFMAQAWGLRPARFGPVAFGLGLLGSIVITLIPAAVFLLLDGLTLLFHAMGYQTVATQ